MSSKFDYWPNFAVNNNFYSISSLNIIFQLTLRKFVTSNALAFAFGLTSTKDEDLRAYGYGILQRYLDLLKELTTEEFSERVWFKYVIRTFKNSVTETNQRIPHG